MTYDEAKHLVERWTRRGGGLSLVAYARRSPTGCPLVAFTGGRWGEHVIDVCSRSAADALAHWRGYCEAHGLWAPAVGQSVTVYDGSWVRTATVLSVGPARARVAFRRRNGARVERAYPFSDVYFLPADQWAKVAP